MKRLSVLFALAATLMIAGAATRADPAPQPAAKPDTVTTPAETAADAVTTQTATAAPAPTLEQIEQQMQGLYLEAGARVERIRVAQRELEHINQSLQQLARLKAQLTGRPPVTPTIQAESK